MSESLPESPYRRGYCPKCLEKGWAIPLKPEDEDLLSDNGPYHYNVSRINYAVCGQCGYRKVLGGYEFEREKDYDEIAPHYRRGLGWALETAFAIALVIFFLKECGAF